MQSDVTTEASCNFASQRNIFYPKLVFGALHGVFHAARILASIETHAQVEALTFQTFVHPHPYPPQDSAFHPAMPVARISPRPNRYQFPDAFTPVSRVLYR